MRRGITFLIHSTEDEERVIRAVLETLSPGVDRSRLSLNRVEGHYKNPIIYVEIPLMREEASRVYRRVMEGLDPREKKRLKGHIEDYMDDKGNLYLRLDKQALCLNRISFSQSDAVRITLRPSKKELEETLAEEG